MIAELFITDAVSKKRNNVLKITGKRGENTILGVHFLKSFSQAIAFIIPLKRPLLTFDHEFDLMI